MNPNLIATPIVDKNGRQTTVRKRVDNGSASKQLGGLAPTLAKPAAKKRRAYKPTENQLRQANFMIPMDVSNDEYWGKKPNRRTAPELAAIPLPDVEGTVWRPKSDTHNYRFLASDVDYYDVMSVVRPWDAANLLARGINSADEAREFLSEHGLEHLIHGKPEFAQELLRGKFNANLSASYLDEIIDADTEPAYAHDWVKACSMKSIEYQAEAIKDEMLSGEISYADLSSVGIRNLYDCIKPVATHITHMRNDDNPDFTVEDITKVMSYEVGHETVEKALGREQTPEKRQRRAYVRLNVARFYGGEAGTKFILPTGPTMWLAKRMHDEGTTNHKELADFTIYTSKLNYSWHKSDEYYNALVDVFRLGIDPDRVTDYLENANDDGEAVDLLRAAKKDIPLSIVDGWL